MSLACGIPFLECVCCLACTRWAWKRLLYSAGHESEHWGLASPEEFEPVPRLCRLILGVYEDDLENPQWPPDGGYRIDTECVVVRKNYAHTQGKAPPYLVYLDHDNKDIILAIRGLNLEKRGDYTVLLDNRLGMKKFDGGYVHNGLLKAAVWVLDAECETLKELIVKYQDYTLTFAGHSLGAGIASLLTIMVMQNRDRLANVERSRIRCFAMAPARCMSLNLALRFADVINSVVLQDDFLPRTATPLEDIFKSLFCLPCLLCMRCVADTFTLEEKMLKDPRRLYAPGRLYHIVNRQLCKCGRFPPVVRTAVPVDGRFDHIVLSCNAISDHGIVWIEKEAQNALDLMLEKDAITSMPPHQKMQRQKTLAKEHSKEHKAALWLAVSLEIPEAYAPSEYGTFDAVGSPEGSTGESSLTREGFQTESWDELTNHLSEKDETTGHTDAVLKETQPHN